MVELVAIINCSNSIVQVVTDVIGCGNFSDSRHRSVVVAVVEAVEIRVSIILYSQY